METLKFRHKTKSVFEAVEFNVHNGQKIKAWTKGAVYPDASGKLLLMKDGNNIGHISKGGWVSKDVPHATRIKGFMMFTPEQFSKYVLTEQVDVYTAEQVISILENLLERPEIMKDAMGENNAQHNGESLLALALTFTKL